MVHSRELQLLGAVHLGGCVLPPTLQSLGSKARDAPLLQFPA
jgi:hypothetical protein